MQGELGILERLGVRRLTNACGPNSRVGGSVLCPEILEAMNEAAQFYVDMNELHDKAGRIIAELVGQRPAISHQGPPPDWCWQLLRA